MIEHRMPNDQYRQSPGLSYSESKLLLKSPLHYAWAKAHPQAFKPSPAMMFGTLTHCALLEPSCFDQRYCVVPDISKNSREYRQLVIDLDAQGLEPITQEQRTWAFEAAESLRQHPRLKGLLSDAACEVSCWWKDKQTGITCKARLDAVVHRDVALLIDVKTTQDASEDAFTRSIVNFQYHRQADWYEQGYAIAGNVEVSPMLFAVVESLPPFACAAYTLDKWFMAQARKLNAQARSIFKYCTEQNEWPGYNDSITDLTAPRWALDADLRDERREEEAYG
jgi:hypothetical protein